MMEKANLMTGRRGAYSAMYSWTQADGFILVASVQVLTLCIYTDTNV
jgi:hypothetical protein